MRDVEHELESELEELMSMLAESDLEAEAEIFAPAGPTGPIFDVACTGCAGGQCVPCQSGLCVACPVHGGGCRTVLRAAIIEAIKLARKAADKVDAATSVEPGKRGKDAKETARLFTFFFCHDPSLPIPWAGGPSGITVAARLRAVAQELDGGRRILFECRPDGGCNAFTVVGQHSTVFLCPPFWGNAGLRGLPEVDRRAATIIHEMLHNLFDVDDFTRQNDPTQNTPRRFDAHCYEAFVLRVNGFGADPLDVQVCGQQPCEVRI
jgi:hypothetical protein